MLPYVPPRPKYSLPTSPARRKNNSRLRKGEGGEGNFASPFPSPGSEISRKIISSISLPSFSSSWHQRCRSSVINIHSVSIGEEELGARQEPEWAECRGKGRNHGFERGKLHQLTHEEAFPKEYYASRYQINQQWTGISHCRWEYVFFSSQELVQCAVPPYDREEGEGEEDFFVPSWGNKTRPGQGCQINASKVNCYQLGISKSTNLTNPWRAGFSFS